MNAISKPSIGAYDVIDHAYEVIVVGAGGNAQVDAKRGNNIIAFTLD